MGINNIQKMLELIILKDILIEYDNSFTYREYINKNYNTSEMEKRFIELGKEFLNKYALNNTEKSD